MSSLKNFFVRLHDELGQGKQGYFVVVAYDDVEARNTAERLCEHVPGLWSVVTVAEV